MTLNTVIDKTTSLKYTVDHNAIETGNVYCL